MRGREERGEVPLVLHGRLYYGRSPPIYRLWEYEIFTKNPYYYVYICQRPLTFMCDPLGPYISPVNDCINLITLIGLPYQLTISTYRLIV